MAPFIAMRIIDGRFTYHDIFKFKIYQRFKDEVDEILTAEGREDLIER